MNNAWLVGDMGFGDGGKGAEVARLTLKHNATLNVRFNGGAQAAHNVVYTDGRHHTFHQYGSGSFSGANTYLGPHVRFDPFAYEIETLELRAKGVKTYLSVHPDCVIVTPLHVLRSEALAYQHRRGSTGVGVGVAARYAEAQPERALYAGDLASERRIRTALFQMRTDFRLDDLTDAVLESIAHSLYEIGLDVELLYPADVFRDHENVVFEGAQGALLHRIRGFTPYVTSSDTSFRHALEMLRGDVKITKVGVTRMYMTRHGRGPFPSEIRSDLMPPELHNTDGKPHLQGAWRTGWLDLQILQYGIDILGGADEIAMSHMDCWTPEFKVIGLRSEQRLGDTWMYGMKFDTETQYVDWIEQTLQHSITVLGRGARVSDREERNT